MRYLLILLLAACGPVPVQISKPSQEQTMRSSQEQTARQDMAADQQSQHQSESRQGTNSMPVIIICNTVSSPNGHCIAPNEDSPVARQIKRNLKWVNQ